MPKQMVESPQTNYAEKFGFHDPEKSVFRAKRGLSKEVVEEISGMKQEPEWMRAIRLKALDHFWKRPLPDWGGDLSNINFDEIFYYIKPTETQVKNWDDVPDYIKRTFDKLGIPEAERKFLAGVGAQYDSEVVYHNIREDLAKQGVIFVDTDTALREYPDLVRQYFGTIIPPNDNKFAALNTAVWSGGSFIYVPEGVHVDIPLQAYFRINAEKMGQFERTLIIAEPGSYVHYVEGCTAPIYTTDSLHSAVVEIIVKPGARIRYTTIQNWSPNVYNLVTKRAVAYEGRDHGVGGRQPGQQAHHEVPQRLPDGARRPRRGALDGLRRRRPAPGRRRQDGARCSLHLVGHHLQVHQQGRRSHQLPRPGEGLPRLGGCQVHGALRRPDPGRGLSLRHLPLHGDRRGAGEHRPRGDGEQDRR